MQDVALIIHAKWIITCETANEILTDHALVIDEGLILDILPSNTVAQQYQADEILTLNDHALLPGFINMHTHLGMNYFRGIADDLSLMEWLNLHIWPREKQFVKHDFVHDASLFGMAEMLRSGTTTFNDMYIFPEAVAQAAETAKMRGFVSAHVIDFPTAWSEDTTGSLRLGKLLVENLQGHPLIKPTIAPHSIYTVTTDSLHEVKLFAERHDLRINMHVQETIDEINDSMKLTNLRPVKRLHDLGLMNSRLLAIHMTQVNEEDLQIVAETKPHIICCPQSNMKLASGACPVTKFKAAGINVALGTDGVASNNDLNMLGEMQTATFLSKLITQNPQSLTAYETLQMATIAGAKALGIDHLIGSLKVGKAADVIAIDLNAIQTQPVYNPASQIVYAAGREQVTDVWVQGRQLLKNRQLTTLNESDLIAGAKEWGEKIRQS